MVSQISYNLPSGNLTIAMENGPALMIYLVKMVIFQFANCQWRVPSMLFTQSPGPQGPRAMLFFFYPVYNIPLKIIQHVVFYFVVFLKQDRSGLSSWVATGESRFESNNPITPRCSSRDPPAPVWRLTWRFPKMGGAPKSSQSSFFVFFP